MPRMVWVRHESDCQQLHVFGRVGVTYELVTFSEFSTFFPAPDPGRAPASGAGARPSVGAGANGAAPVFGGLAVALTPAFFFVLGRILSLNPTAEPSPRALVLPRDGLGVVVMLVMRRST